MRLFCLSLLYSIIAFFLMGEFKNITAALKHSDVQETLLKTMNARIEL